MAVGEAAGDSDEGWVGVEGGVAPARVAMAMGEGG